MTNLTHTNNSLKETPNYSLTERYLQSLAGLKMKDVEPNIILKVLTKGMLLLGVKGDKLPIEYEIKYMINELKGYYGNLPLDELDLAFELASKNKLDVISETYQNFSVLYLNNMMSAYARWAMNQKAEIKPKFKELKQNPMSEEEVIELSFDSYKKFKQWDNIFLCMRTFNILHKQGKLEYQDIEKIVTDTENAIKDKMIGAEKDERKQLQDIYNNDDDMELYCRKMSVAQYFTKLINDK